MRTLFICFLITHSINTFSQNIGINNPNPKASFHLNGDLVFDPVSIIVSDTLINVIDINTVKARNYILTGPSGNFALSGISCGVNGREINLSNMTGHSMEIYNDYLFTADSMRIQTGTGSTLAVYSGGNVSLRYDTTLLKWIVVCAHHYNLNYYGGENHWSIEHDSILYANKEYVSINSDLNLQPQQTNLQIKGGILAQSGFTYTTSSPLEGQTYTMNNMSQMQFLNFQDSVSLILDPGGANDYGNNMQGNMQLISTLGVEIKFDPTNFGIGLGDTLWISKKFYPYCQTDYFYRITNTNSPPNPFTLTTVGESTFFIFRSNGDGNNGIGFEITARKLYESQNVLQNISPIGHAFYFDPNNSSIRAGLLNTANLGDYSIGMGNKPVASGDFSISLGDQSSATGVRSVAIGAFCNASGLESTSFGAFNYSTGNSSLSMGYGNVASGHHSTALGLNTQAIGNFSTAMGESTIASGNNSVSMGQYASTGGFNKSFVFNGSSNAQFNNYTINTAPNQMMMNFNEYVFWTNTLGKQVKFWSDGGISTTGGICAEGTIVGSQTNCFSDLRLKNNIITINTSLPKILNIRPVNFTWKDKSKSENIQTGVIAQEIQEIFPELVDELETGILTVNYQGFIPHLIRAVQEQQSEIEMLNSKIIKLEAMIENISHSNKKNK